MAMKAPTFTRRELFSHTAGLAIGISMPGRIFAATPDSGLQPDAYVRIAPDDTVTVFVKHIEMGQGSYTSLATLVAEELDADWKQIRARSAPADAALYGSPMTGGLQQTGGSRGIASSYDLMRRAGATARAMLVEAAAARWQVPGGEITVEKGVILHARSKRSGRFGEFAQAAASLPVPQEVTPKKPEDFTLIGREGAVRRLDTQSKANGTALYASDILEPDLLTVVVAHPPKFGARLGKMDPGAALSTKGVVAVKPIPSGVAVYAHGTWPAIQGREALKIEWDDSDAEKRSSEQIIEEFLAVTKTAGAVAAQTGDVDAALAGGGELIEATYVFPYLAHAPMEPLSGYLRWNRDGATARYGCQSQTVDQQAIAGVLQLPVEQVAIDTMLAGGSFGRRVNSDAAFAIELAEAAKAIGPDRPIKLIWTREDDIQGGKYRPLTVHRLRGTVKDGKITAWSNRIASQSFLEGTRFAAFIKNGVDRTVVEGSNKLLYDIDNFRCELHLMPGRVTGNSWRSVGHSHTGYAVECFVDLLLDKLGKDPVAGRLELMKNEPRAVAVLKAVAERAKWTGSGPVNGRARGVAIIASFGTYVAQIAEVSIDTDREPKVHKMWCAIDCGTVVNPDIVRAQMEGSIGYGLGHALYAEVPIDAGAAAVSNFHDYPSLAMRQMPEMDILVLPSAERPTGAGEPGVPPSAPAVANALARLTGSRAARLPIVRRA